MRHELAVQIDIVFSNAESEGRNVDGHMQHAKEGQCKHGWHGGNQGIPIDEFYIWKDVD